MFFLPFFPSLSLLAALPPRREPLGECTYSEQLEQNGEENQSVRAAVRRHLPLLDGAVQVHRGGGRVRVSTPL